MRGISNEDMYDNLSQIQPKFAYNNKDKQVSQKIIFEKFDIICG